MSDLLHPDPAEPDESPEDPVDPGEFVLAVAAEDQLEAQLLVAVCEEAGIPAILQSPRSGPVGTIASPVDAFSILVPQRDLERAQALIEERKRILEADPDGAARAAEDEEAESEP
jgi:Putative prokaryotic signal transducing protein